MREITEAEFDKEFTSVEIPEEGNTKTQHNAGSMVWEIDQIQDLLPGVEANHIWSWTDGDNGGTYLVAGVHHVNVYGFRVTKESHNFDIEVVIETPEDEHNRHFVENHSRMKEPYPSGEKYYDHMEQCKFA